jgi:hypothetical protein
MREAPIRASLHQQWENTTAALASLFDDLMTLQIAHSIASIIRASHACHIPDR